LHFISPPVLNTIEMPAFRHPQEHPRALQGSQL
jgi:hypothetical protein